MLLIHRALENRLRDLAASDRRVAAIVTEEQHQEPYLLADLDALGSDSSSIEALPATADLIRKIDEASEREPIRLLGFHYVLEGSNNGNAFIARAVRPALGLEPGAGDRYLDPYGERQRAVWAAFKSGLDAQAFASAEQDAMIGAARDMFEGISMVSQELPTA
jgi:heme oxygenase